MSEITVSPPSTHRNKVTFRTLATEEEDRFPCLQKGRYAHERTFLP